MTAELSDWYFLREGFETFRIEPERHANLLIGKRDREHRNWILRGLEESYLGREGFKAVVYGDYGRGKTHQCRNLIYEIEHRGLDLIPSYVKCVEYRAKEPFGTLFESMVTGLRSDELNRVATEYERLVNSGEARPILEVVESEDIEQGFKALASPNHDIVRLAMKWLGGSGELTRTDREKIGGALTKQMTVSRDFAAIAKGLSAMFRAVDGKQVVFFLDEVERFGQITHDDTYWSWVASLRALTELVDIGFIFFVGAKTRDEIPNMLVWDEIATRIGITNFRDLLNPGREELRSWVVELFQTLIQKGEPPEPLRDALSEAARDPKVPDELKGLVEGDPARLEAFPLTPDALDTFVEHCVAEELANKPREVLKRIQKAAARALLNGERTIDPDLLDEVRGDGF